jgi:hypothetical protein
MVGEENMIREEKRLGKRKRGRRMAAWKQATSTVLLSFRQVLVNVHNFLQHVTQHALFIQHQI